MSDKAQSQGRHLINCIGFRSSLASSPPLWPTPVWATTASTAGPVLTAWDSNRPATVAASERGQLMLNPASPGVLVLQSTHGEVHLSSAEQSGVLARGPSRSVRLNPASPGVLALQSTHGEVLPSLAALSGVLARGPSRSVRLKPRLRLSLTGATEDMEVTVTSIDAL